MHNDDPVSLVPFFFLTATNGNAWAGTDPLPGVVDLLEIIAYGAGKDEKSAMHTLRLAVASEIPTTDAQFNQADPVFRFTGGTPGARQGTILVPTVPAVVSIKGPFRIQVNGRRIVLEHHGGNTPATILAIVLRLRAAPPGGILRRLLR